jgi:hypothetical protein
VGDDDFGRLQARVGGRPEVCTDQQGQRHGSHPRAWEPPAANFGVRHFTSWKPKGVRNRASPGGALP